VEGMAPSGSVALQMADLVKLSQHAGDCKGDKRLRRRPFSCRGWPQRGDRSNWLAGADSGVKGVRVEKVLGIARGPASVRDVGAEGGGKRETWATTSLSEIPIFFPLRFPHKSQPQTSRASLLCCTVSMPSVAAMAEPA